jgi:hypothetical protein
MATDEQKAFMEWSDVMSPLLDELWFGHDRWWEEKTLDNMDESLDKV